LAPVKRSAGRGFIRRIAGISAPWRSSQANCLADVSRLPRAVDSVYHPDRLTHPLRRVGPKGGGLWERVSWNEAIAEIAERWKAIIAEYGAAAILPYSFSGTLGLVQLVVVNERLWNRLGASGLERPPRPVGHYRPERDPHHAQARKWPKAEAERSAQRDLQDCGGE